MPNWKEVLWKSCEKAYYEGGEVRITFVRRQDKVIPIVVCNIDNRMQCDEETIIREED